MQETLTTILKIIEIDLREVIFFFSSLFNLFLNYGKEPPNYVWKSFPV